MKVKCFEASLHVHRLQRNHIGDGFGLAASLVKRLDFGALPGIAGGIHTHHFVFWQDATSKALFAAIDACLAVGAPQKIFNEEFLV